MAVSLILLCSRITFSAVNKKFHRISWLMKKMGSLFTFSFNVESSCTFRDLEPRTDYVKNLSFAICLLLVCIALLRNNKRWILLVEARSEVGFKFVQYCFLQSSAMDISCEISNSSLEATELWTPGSEVREYSHEQWLTRLACTLIKSGFVKDEVLIVLSPICDVKVIWLACSF